jgi:hypothetical protein
VQLSATELHNPDEAGTSPTALAELFQALRPDVIFVPATADEQLVAQLCTASRAAQRGGVGEDGEHDAASDASVYNWPAPSEAAGLQSETELAGNDDVVQLVSSKHFKLPQVSPRCLWWLGCLCDLRS